MIKEEKEHYFEEQYKKNVFALIRGKFGSTTITYPVFSGVPDVSQQDYNEFIKWIMNKHNGRTP